MVEEYTKVSHNLLDKGQIPVVELEDLNLCQIQGINHLRQAAEDIEVFNGFEIYSKALEKLEKQEVAHA